MRTEREVLRKGVDESAVALATKNPSPIPIKAAGAHLQSKPVSLQPHSNTERGEMER